MKIRVAEWEIALHNKNTVAAVEEIIGSLSC